MRTRITIRVSNFHPAIIPAEVVQNHVSSKAHRGGKSRSVVQFIRRPRSCLSSHPVALRFSHFQPSATDLCNWLAVVDFSSKSNDSAIKSRGKVSPAVTIPPTLSNFRLDQVNCYLANIAGQKSGVQKTYHGKSHDSMQTRFGRKLNF